MKEDQSGEQVLAVSVARAAELIGIGRSTYYEYVKSGILPLDKIGNRSIVILEKLRKQLRDL